MNRLPIVKGEDGSYRTYREVLEEQEANLKDLDETLDCFGAPSIAKIGTTEVL